MNYPRLLFIFGLLIVLIPFLGVPLLWKHIATVALGIVVISVSILLRAAIRHKKTPAPIAVPARKTRAPRQRTAPARSSDRLSSVMKAQQAPVVSAETIDQPSVAASIDTEESSHEQA